MTSDIVTDQMSVQRRLLPTSKTKTNRYSQQNVAKHYNSFLSNDNSRSDDVHDVDENEINSSTRHNDLDHIAGGNVSKQNIDNNDKKFKQSFVNVFLPHSVYILYILLSFIQELPVTSIAWILNKEAKFTPAELMTYYNLTFIPWTIKPLWALISDNIPICGYRRKPYLLMCSLGASICFVMILLYGFKDKMTMQYLGVLLSLCTCVCEIQTDALVIALTNILFSHQQELLKTYPQFKPMTYEEKLRLEAIQSKNDNQKVIDSDGKDENSKNNILHNVTNAAVAATGQIATPDYQQILKDNPNLYNTLTSQDWKLLTTIELKSSLQSEAMTCRTVASFGAAGLSMLLHLFLTPHWVVLCCAILPLLVLCCIGWVPEHQTTTSPLSVVVEEEHIIPQPSSSQEEEEEAQEQEENNLNDNNQSTKINNNNNNDDDSSSESLSSSTTSTRIVKQSICSYIWSRIKALFQGIVIMWKPLLFVLLLRSMPNSTDPLMSYIFGELDLPPWVLSGYGLINIAAGLLATIIYWKYCQKCSLILTFLFGTIFAAICTLPTACLTAQCNVKWFHIPNWAYVIITTIISAIASRFALMPSLSLAVQATDYKNLKLEASIFTTYTAMNNIGALLSFSSSMYLLHHFNITSTNFTKLPEMIVTCALTSLLPLLALPLVKCSMNELEAQRAKEKAEVEKATLKSIPGAIMVINLDNNKKNDNNNEQQQNQQLQSSSNNNNNNIDNVEQHRQTTAIAIGAI